MCQSLFFIIVAGPSPALLKKEALAQVFFCEFCGISKNTFFTELLWVTAPPPTLSCSCKFSGAMFP